MMENATLITLIENVKQECAITWDDEDTEADVQRIIESAATVLSHKLGVSGDGRIFTVPGYAKMLFEKYCHYAWNNVLEEFETNYIRDIIAARHYYQIKGESETEETEG